MALVSYGSSDESNLSGTEDEHEQTGSFSSEGALANSTSKPQGDISDEENEPLNQSQDDEIGSILDDTAHLDDNPLTNVSSGSLFGSLPASQTSNRANEVKTQGVAQESKNRYVDENEDMDTIPERKVYQGGKAELKPTKTYDSRLLKGIGQKDVSVKKGPVRILAPTLLSDRDIEEGGPPRKKFVPFSTKTGLLGLLPKPKNTSIPKETKGSFHSFDLGSNKETDKVSNGPTTSKASSSQALIPRSVSRKPISNVSRPSTKVEKEVAHRKETKRNIGTANKTLTESDSDSEPSSFFTIEDKPLPPSTSVSNTASSFISNPASVAPEDRPLNFIGDSFTNKQRNISEEPSVIRTLPHAHSSTEVYYGEEAVAPYPPVATSRANNEEDLMANEEALERLAGRVRRGRGGQNKEIVSENIIEVNQGDLTADPREWLTKTLTQDDEGPGPRCNIGGQTKRKHQITYMAAMAKQNENELKRQWAENATSRRAHQSKYGF